MRFMYDSVTPEEIPRDAQMVAGYIDGTVSHRWIQRDWDMFPNAVKVRIARVPETNDGHVLDVEPNVNGGEWPPGPRMVQWVQRRRAATGTQATIYCNQLNDWSTVRNVFKTAGVAEPLYWVARYNNVVEIPPGAIAKQYAHPPQLGFNADKSAVADFWPGVDGKPDMALSDEYFEFMTGGQKVRVKALDALANLYIERFYGSGTMPWAGPSGRAIDLGEYAEKPTEVDPTFAAMLADALVARGVGGATPEQVTEALKGVFRQAAE